MRTLGHTGVRWWLGNRIHKFSLLFDILFRVVDLELAGVMAAGSVNGGR